MIVWGVTVWMIILNVSKGMGGAKRNGEIKKKQKKIT